MASTQTTETLTPEMQTFYDNVFLQHVEEKLVIGKMAVVKNVPLYKGKIIDFFRRFPITETTTEITEGSETMNQTDFKGENIQATIKHYAQWSKYSRFVSMTSRDPELNTLVEEYANAAARVVDKLLMEECIKNGSIPVRIDQLATTGTYTRTGIVDTGVSTTIFTDASLTETTANFFKGGHFAVFDGTNYGHGSLVADYASGSLTLSTAAMNTYGTDSNYRLVVGTGLAAANKLTGTACKYGVALAKAAKFYPFNGDWFHTILCAETESDLMDDTVFLAVAENHGDDKSIYNGLIKALWGQKFFRGTTPYRESVAGVYSATGVVFCTPILGQYALGRCNLAGQGEPKIIVKSPGPQTTSQPYNENKTVAYDMFNRMKALNAAFAVNLMSGATAVLK